MFILVVNGERETIIDKSGTKVIALAEELSRQEKEVELFLVEAGKEKPISFKKVGWCYHFLMEVDGQERNYLGKSKSEVVAIALRLRSQGKLLNLFVFRKGKKTLIDLFKIESQKLRSGGQGRGVYKLMYSSGQTRIITGKLKSEVIEEFRRERRKDTGLLLFIKKNGIFSEIKL